jgi:hypothetical protein
MLVGTQNVDAWRAGQIFISMHFVFKRRGVRALITRREKQRKRTKEKGSGIGCQICFSLFSVCSLSPFGYPPFTFLPSFAPPCSQTTTGTTLSGQADEK